MKKMISRREMLRRLALATAGSLVACQTPNQPATPAHPTVMVSQPQAKSQARIPSQTAESAPTQARGAEVAAGTPQVASTPSPSTPSAGQTYLSVARGEDPAAITEAALKALGGIERFVKNGYTVIIKPNIGMDNFSFEYGATTNPIVVATLVRLALGAGAKTVRVMDYPFAGTAESAYARSGIADAVKAAGGVMEAMNPNKFRTTSIPGGESLTECAIYQDVFNCDLLIDVPIAKQSSPSTLSCGGKNLMGVIQNRGAMHANLGVRIADLMSTVRPQLTVVDGVRTIMRNGPTGGSLDDVKINNTVIASQDIVAADSYAARLIGLTGADVPYIAAAAKRGLGKMDLSGMKIEEINS